MGIRIRIRVSLFLAKLDEFPSSERMAYIVTKVGSQSVSGGVVGGGGGKVKGVRSHNSKFRVLFHITRRQN